MAKSFVSLVAMAGAAVFATTTVLQYRENARLHTQLATLRPAVLDEPSLQHQQTNPPISGPTEKGSFSSAQPKPVSWESATNQAGNVSKGAPFPEITARIQGFYGGSSARRTLDWRKIIADVRAEDIPRVMVLVEKESQRSARDLARQDLLGRWAESDPNAAIAYAAAIKEESARYSAIQSVVSAWSMNDPAAAEAWGRALPAGQLRDQALGCVCNGLADKNPQAAYDLYKTFAQKSRHWGALSQIFDCWAKMDPATAILKAGELTGQQRIQAMQTIAYAWGGKDPQAALAWANSLPMSQKKDGYINSMLSQWADTDPQQASLYANNLPAGEARNNAVISVAMKWARSDPKSALAFVQNMPAGQSLNALLGNIANSMGAADPKTAMAYVNQIPEGEARAAFIVGLASGMARNTPEEAAGFVASQPAGPSQNRAAQAVVSQWASVDPPAAAAWVTRFPQGETRDNALQQVAARWANSDPVAASKWLASLPADKFRDRLVQSYIGSTTYEYPDMAAAWAETISDPNQRISAIENIGRVWLRTDRVSAEKWINQMSLPDDKKQNLLKTPQASTFYPQVSTFPLQNSTFRPSPFTFGWSGSP